MDRFPIGGLVGRFLQTASLGPHRKRNGVCSGSGARLASQARCGVRFQRTAALWSAAVVPRGLGRLPNLAVEVLSPREETLHSLRKVNEHSDTACGKSGWQCPKIAWRIAMPTQNRSTSFKRRTNSRRLSFSVGRSKSASGCRQLPRRRGQEGRRKHKSQRDPSSQRSRAESRSDPSSPTPTILPSTFARDSLFRTSPHGGCGLSRS